MSPRNVPFLLNASLPKRDNLADRILLGFGAYLRRRRFREFDCFLRDIESIVAGAGGNRERARPIETAASKIPVQGERYPEEMQKMVGR